MKFEQTWNGMRQQAINMENGWDVSIGWWVLYSRNTSTKAMRKVSVCCRGTCSESAVRAGVAAGRGAQRGMGLYC